MALTAEQTAAALLEKYRVDQPPVPIEEIAAAEGALVVRNHFQGHESGFALRENGGRWIIGVNTATSPRRQRFTVAHELGHLLLHEGTLITDYSIYLDKRDERSSLGTDKQEIEANRFAAELLMPQKLLVAELQKELRVGAADSRDALIAKLAKSFSVSVEAMSYRLVNLNIIAA
jgi:Zn-dependent peptidase ImmA (M78 family)